MKHIGRTLARVWVIGIGACCLLASCFGDDRYLYGTCAEDADLRTPYNFYEGATCVDGVAQCPDGQSFCQRIARFDDNDRVIQTCTGPCIACPGHRGACIALDHDTNQLYHFCADTFTDCWDDGYFLLLDSATERCPLMTPDCW